MVTTAPGSPNIVSTPQLIRVSTETSADGINVMGSEHVESVADLACRAALSQRGVAHINFPVDFQSQSAERKKLSTHDVRHHTSHVYAQSAQLPNESDLQQAAEVLNSGKNIAILAGRGALRAGDELEQLAEVLGAPIVKAMLGKAAVPDDNPYTTGGIGLVGTKPSQDVMESCDTLLMIGTSFPYMEFLPKPGQARGVQMDLDPIRIGLRYPIEV